MKELYLVGGGGHCLACIDVIENCGEYRIMGIFDLETKIGQDILEYKIIDSDKNIKKYVNENTYFLISIGQIKSPELRVKKYEELRALNANMATVISKRAFVSPHATVGAGSIVMHDAVVNVAAIVGENCILNTKSLIEHNAIVEDHCHISTGCILNGEAIVRTRSFIGSNTTLRERAIVEANSVIPFGVKV